MKDKLKQLRIWLRGNNKAPFVVIPGIIIVLGIGFFAFRQDNDIPKEHPLAGASVPFAKEKEDMTGIAESVDPRDTWTARVEQKVNEAKEEMGKNLAAEKEQTSKEVAALGKEIAELKELLALQEAKREEEKLAGNIRLAGESALPGSDRMAPAREKSSLGYFSRNYGNSKKKNYKEYVPSGSFARAVLMTGVVVGTGSNSASNPEPIMLRLTDAGIFSKGKRTDQIKEAILIGDCSGDLSSERAKCRLQTLSLENIHGEIVEQPVKGWVIGEDGRFGIKGRVVDKSSDLLRMAMLNGLLGGMSKFLENQSTKSIYPISPFTGQQNALKDLDTLKGGIAHGAGDAFSKMADFVMERFNSMSPQIVIASGREVDVVFQHGVDLNGSWDEASEKVSDGNFDNWAGDQEDGQGSDFARDSLDSFSDAMRKINEQSGTKKKKGGQHDGF